MARIDLETRINAFHQFQEMRKNNISRQNIVNLINQNFGISKTTVYDWFREKRSPFTNIGNFEFKKELFYVLGALLGDGYLYHWRGNYYVGILVKEEIFAKKFARKLSKCIKRSTKAYNYAKRNLWFVRIGNAKLFFLFRDIRNNSTKLFNLIKKNSKENSIQLIEGFFDAEGCVKVIKEEVRKTPKICLDITNTNYEILQVLKILLKKKLNINSRFSIQKDNHLNRKTAYHLRIYKKDFINKFLKNIQTTKLTPVKIRHVENWLNN